MGFDNRRSYTLSTIQVVLGVDAETALQWLIDGHVPGMPPAWDEEGKDDGSHYTFLGEHLNEAINQRAVQLPTLKLEKKKRTCKTPKGRDGKFIKKRDTDA